MSTESTGVIWEALDDGGGFGLGLGADIEAFAILDDGTSRTLYVGGDFSVPDGRGITGLARWTGSGWAPVASAPFTEIDHVLSLATFDSGGGAELYAAGVGGTTSIARYDGSSWIPIGQDLTGRIEAMTTWDDGSGPALYAGGRLTLAGVSGRNVVRWDGQTWSPVGASSPFSSAQTIEALVGHDDGSGPKLYAGGTFSALGGASAQNLARWDGTSWSEFGGGTVGRVTSLQPVDLPSTGPGLVVGGYLTMAGGQPHDLVALWNGTAWSAMPGLGGSLWSLAVHTHDDESHVFASGLLTRASGADLSDVVFWDGSAWRPVPGGEGLAGRALASRIPSARRAELWVGGSFAESETFVAEGVTRRLDVNSQARFATLREGSALSAGAPALTGRHRRVPDPSRGSRDQLELQLEGAPHAEAGLISIEADRGARPAVHGAATWILPTDPASPTVGLTVDVPLELVTTPLRVRAWTLSEAGLEEATGLAVELRPARLR